MTTAVAPAPIPELTGRERQVLELLAQGLSFAEMGEQLRLSVSTVKTHISNVYAKLGVTKSGSAVMTAVRLGLLQLEPGPAAVIDTNWCAEHNYLGPTAGHTCPTRPVRVHIHTN